MANEDTSMEDLSRILNFDPFAEPPPDAPEAPEALEPAPPEDTAVAPESTPPEPQVDQSEAIRRELEETRRQLAYLQGQMQKPEVKPETPAEPQIPEYNFNLPEPLVKLLESEDAGERRQGLAYLAQGVARTVHMNALQEIQRARQELAAMMPQYVQAVNTQQTQAQEVFRDFYGKNQDLDRPELRSLVVGTAQQVIQETGANNWTPELRDKIAGRVRSVLGAYASPGRRSNQPANVRGGTRPGAPAVTSQAADILDTLFGPGG
jgi:hypothetical protein